MQFSFREDANAREHGDVLFGVQLVDGVDARVDSPHASLDGIIRPVRIVTVTVEDALFVLLQKVRGNVERLFAAFDAVGDNLERFRSHGVQARVDQRNVLSGTGGSELKSRATVRERRSSVTIFRRYGDIWDVRGAKRQRFLFRRVLGHLTVLDLFQVFRQGRAQVRGHNRRRRFHSTQSEIVTRGGNGQTHQVAVFVDGRNQSSHDDREDFRVARRLVQLFRVEQVDASGRTDRPVIVLTGTVDTREWLFVQQGRHAVLRGDFFDNLHDHQVLVDLVDDVAKHRRKLVLVRRDFSVTRLQRNTNFVAFGLDLLHGFESTSRARDRGHVMVRQFLASRGVFAHNRSPGEL